MSDNHKILEHSIGTHMCWIFDYKGVPITLDDVYGNTLPLNQFITKFSYKYDEENDDECKITIRVHRSSQLNNDNFFESNRLKVQWGYITHKNSVPIKSPIRIVAIRDLDTVYTDDLIELNLVCTDVPSYLRQSKINKTSDTDYFTQWLVEMSKGMTNTITEYGVTSVFVEQPDWFGSDETAAYAKREKVGLNIGNSPGLSYPNGSWATNKGTGVAVTLEAQKRLDQLKNGPSYRSGQDENIKTIIRNWSQAPFAVFTYAGGNGELIEFKPKTNIVKTDISDVESSWVSPFTKKAHITTLTKSKEEHSNINNFGKTKPMTFFDGLAIPSDVDKYGFKKKVSLPENYREVVISTLKKNFDAKVADPLNAGANPSYFSVRNHTKETTYMKANMPSVFAIGTGEVEAPPAVVEKVEEDFYRFGDVLRSGIVDPEIRMHMAENYMKKKVEKKYEAQAKFIGDPTMITSKIYQIKGLSNIDNGNWYSIIVTHDIDFSTGYICEVNFLRKPKFLRTILERREQYPSELSDPNTPLAENLKQTEDPYVVTEYDYPDLPPGKFSGNSEYDMMKRAEEQIASNETNVENTVKSQNA